FDSFKFHHLSEWKFKPLISFDSIWKFYVFDRELRLLVMDALERIEIAFRTALSDTMSLLYEPHWYLNRELFKNIELHDVLLKQITEICRYRNDDQHIKKYYGQYSHPDFPPSWIIMEFLSFGACLSTFQNLKKLNDKKAICRLLTYNPVAIESWMAALRYTRN